MAKFSVKKPFTVLVGVILALVLGVVSVMGMPTDLLPTMSLPYLMVMTTYPGASPEKVESDITAPLEAALGTINGVENVTSTSSENYSMIILEFSEETNLDSAMVKATTKLNQLSDVLPERAGTPSIMELSADMMATEYVAVAYEGMDIYQLSNYVQEQIIPAIERIDGVARVSAVGLVEKNVEVRLNQEKIDEINDKVLTQVSERLAEAKEKLDEAQEKLDKGKSQLGGGKSQLASGQAQLKQQQQAAAKQLSEMLDAVKEKIPQLEQQLGSMETQIEQAANSLNSLGDRLGDLADALHTGEEGTFSTLHAVIADNAPQWYEANFARLPGSLGEILDNPASLEALIEGLEAARGSILGVIQQNADLEQQVAAAQADLAAADGQIATLEEALRLAKNPEPIWVPAPMPEEPPEPFPEEPPAGEGEAEGEALIEAFSEEGAEGGGNGSYIYPEVDEETVALLEEQLLAARESRDVFRAALDAALAIEPLPVADTDPEVIAQIISLLREAQSFMQLLDTADDTLYQLSSQLEELNSYRAQLEGALRALRNNPMDANLGQAAAQLIFSGMNAQLAVGQLQISSGEAQLQNGQTQLDAAKAEYEAAREEALSKANLNDLLNMQTLAQLIGAQNFSMPAGYIQDGEDKILLKVGDSYESVDELTGALLCSMDGVGDVRLSDVADVTVTDNAGSSYARVGNNQAVLLSIYKGSTASTSEVSNACNDKSAKLMEADPLLHLTAIMDQGEYIRLIIKTVMSSLIQGAILAVIVLIFFLKDVRPTLVVAVSIPLSVLVALVAMYFSNISLNMVSLSGLALGIGMLVDNSIVVIENIYRLRSRDIPAPRAAVQGTRQVAGSIISSTITTICVFLPLLFAGGLVRQLMTDMALAITYSLLASLVVAMTVVPCAGSTLLQKGSEKQHPWFDKALGVYEKLLRFCLNRKVVPLGITIALLVVCVFQTTRMGLTMIPQISSNQMTLSVTVPEGTSQEEAYAAADAVMEAALAVDGIDTIGAMSSNSAGALMSGGLLGGGGGSDTVSGFSYFIVLNEKGGRNQAGVQAALLDATRDLPCTVEVAGSSMADASMLTGSGVEIDLYGDDLDTLLELSTQVSELLSQVPGITDVSNGQEAGDKVAKIIVDKDKAMRLGLTVAQVYGELAKALTTDTTSTTLTAGGESYTVTIIDTTKVPELKDILRHPFQTQSMDENGKMVKETHTLGEFARRENAEGVASISRENLSRVMKVTSSTGEGYNTALLARDVQKKLDTLTVPEGYLVQIAGESTQVTDMVIQMAGMLALALLLIYLVMVAQFQSLLSPFIVLFTVPLAFTGGLLAILISGESISMMSLMGFLILMGVVVNNGIVFVDYTNQLRLGGLPRVEALVAAGKTRMRPILMTTLTTVLSMVTMLFSHDPGSEVGKGMAVVIVGGLLYATIMTLVIVPVMYDILFKKQPVEVDVGEEGMDDLPDDAAEFLAQLNAQAEPQSE